MRLVAVLGYSGRRRGELHVICEARVRHAETLDADAVLLSGEAELMQGAWRGGDVVLDTRGARNTRENARGVAEAARRLEADEVVVVTPPARPARERCVRRRSATPPSRSPARPRPAHAQCGCWRESSSASPRYRCSFWPCSADQRVGRRPVGGTRGR
jgi:hypothetical protein